MENEPTKKEIAEAESCWCCNGDGCLACLQTGLDVNRTAGVHPANCPHVKAGALLPSEIVLSIAPIDPDGWTWTGRLAEANAATQLTNDRLDLWVVEALRHGLSLRQVASAIGMSAEGVRKRYAAELGALAQVAD